MLEGLISAVVEGALACALAGDALLVPRWSVQAETTIACNLDGAATVDELRLEGHRLLAFVNGSEVPGTRRSWIVSQAFATDLDGDQMDEAVVLFWRRGSYGTSHPFWLKGADDELCQHVGVLYFDGERMRQRWTSSALGAEVSQARIEEGRLVLEENSGATTSWEWDGWGFARVAPSAG